MNATTRPAGETSRHETAEPRPGRTAIASIGLVTSRLPALRRALASYVENTRAHGRAPDFVVVDDSRDADVREACRQMLGALKATHGVRLRYAGLEEKLAWADRLVARGHLPPEVVRFALFGVEPCRNTSGANRNALLLDTVGELTLSVDDDTVCRIAAAPDRSDDLAVVSDRDPSGYWFFPDRETALGAVGSAERDVLAIHEQLLGKPLESLLRTPAALVGVSEASPEARRRLDADHGSVAVTFSGLVGDCGWGAPFGGWGAPMGYLLLPEDSHRRLTGSASLYRSACTSREILRVVSRPTLADASFSMATFAGLDNRTLLPPFMPVQRGQDVIFGATLWGCFEDRWFGHLPWALLHAPSEPRRFWPGEIVRTAAGVDTARLVLACLDGFESRSANTTAPGRLQHLGAYLGELGSLPARDFEAFVTDRVTHTTRAFASLMEERLERAGAAPDFWAHDVERYLHLMRRSLSRRDYWLPLDLLDGGDVEGARRLAQRLVRELGGLYSWWPALMEAAADLKAGGERLTRPI